jgi:hypothetical protein
VTDKVLGSVLGTVFSKRGVALFENGMRTIELEYLTVFHRKMKS